MTPTLADLLAACSLPRVQARALLAHACDRSREWLIAHADERCPPGADGRFASLVARATDGEPLAYLLGSREFRGLSLSVDRSVLIPRPETEALVDWAVDRAPQGATVLDLGTGSGAIAIALALARPDLTMIAVDHSAPALALAASNARRLGARVRFGLGDWWSGLPDVGPLNIVLGNPPYIAADDPHLRHDGLPFEPRSALVAGSDGMNAYRAIVAGLPRRRLAPGARLLFEHGYRQAAAVRALLRGAGLVDPFTLADDQGHDRFSGARLV
ncbi:MAG: peptide chain release factor N(5)-glutamine methyltransferase [Burkholderiaceae bacterium]